MSQAVSQMDQLTQQNAALVEEAAAAAAAMRELAASLAEAVSIFKIDGLAVPAVATPARRAPTMARGNQGAHA